MARSWIGVSALACICSWIGIADAQIARSSLMIQLRLNAETIQATPIMATDKRVMMLSRDGQLWDFAPADASNFVRLPNTFQPMRQGELRGDLMAEFGREYEVSGTGSYLVVHPKGEKDQWAKQFESLYRSFQHYFSARGIRPHRNEFPLVAIVFPDFASYKEYAAQYGMRVSPAVVGFYSSLTNRVAVYDVTKGNKSHPNWQENMNTIIHEATHQTAFNCGIHNRYAPQPKWVVEGLATMFEAPGVWDSKSHPNYRDRVNRQRLGEFLQYASSSRKPNSLAEFVAKDDAYLHHPRTAYGEGWALLFFLIETRPREFARYLEKVASRPADQPYDEVQRIMDFQAAFGRDLDLLESHFLSYMQQVPHKL